MVRLPKRETNTHENNKHRVSQQSTGSGLVRVCGEFQLPEARRVPIATDGLRVAVEDLLL